MIRKFKHPITGKIAEYQPGSRNYYKITISEHQFETVPAWIVENEWEEIKEIELKYKILSIINKSHKEILSDESNINCWLAGSGKDNWSINSILFLDTDTIFTIGDHIVDTSLNYLIIKEFLLINNFITVSFNNTVIKHSLNNIRKQEPLFIAMDGPSYKGEFCYKIKRIDPEKYYHIVTNDYNSIDAINYFYFNKKENVEEYYNTHKVIIITKDGFSLHLNDTFYYYEPVSKHLSDPLIITETFSSVFSKKLIFFHSYTAALEYKEKNEFFYTTADGVDIKKGDICWYLNCNNFHFQKESVTFKPSINTYYKYFFDETKLKEYILMNKPCLCLKDIITYNDNFKINISDINKEKYRKLAESKIKF